MAITGGFETAAALLLRQHEDGAPAAAATARPAGGPEPEAKRQRIATSPFTAGPGAVAPSGAALKSSELADAIDSEDELIEKYLIRLHQVGQLFPCHTEAQHHETLQENYLGVKAAEQSMEDAAMAAMFAVAQWQDQNPEKMPSIMAAVVAAEQPQGKMPEKMLSITDDGYDSAEDDESEGKYDPRKNWRGTAKGSAKKPYVPIPFNERATAISRILAEVKKQQEGGKRNTSAFPMPDVTHVVPREDLTDYEQSQLYEERSEMGTVARGFDSLDVYEAIGRAMPTPITTRAGWLALRCIGKDNLDKWAIHCLADRSFKCLQCFKIIIAKEQSAKLRNHERSHLVSQTDWDAFIDDLAIHYTKNPHEKTKMGWRNWGGKRLYNVGIFQKTNRSLHDKTRRTCGLDQKNGKLPVSGDRAKELKKKFGLEVTPYDATIFGKNNPLSRRP